MCYNLAERVIQLNIIRELRKKKGILQKTLADEIGVSIATISDWEMGKKNPSGERLQKLARFFNVDELVILGKSVIDLNVSSSLEQSKGLQAKTQRPLTRSIDYNDIAIKVTQLLIEKHITSVPIDSLSILQSRPDVFVGSFTEMADGAGLDRSHLSTFYGAANQDAITFIKEIDGRRCYFVAYNQSLPFYIVQRSLARELGHIVLGHDESTPEDIATTEALYFARHLLYPRPLLKSIQDSNIRLSIKVLGNITGCYGRFLTGVRQAPGAKVPPELNRIVRAQFANYLNNFLKLHGILSSDDDSSLADFGSFMDNYLE